MYIDYVQKWKGNSYAYNLEESGCLPGDFLLFATNNVFSTEFIAKYGPETLPQSVTHGEHSTMANKCQFYYA